MNDGGLLGSLDQWVRQGWGRFLLLVAALTVAGSAVFVILTVVLTESGLLAEDSRFWHGDRPDWAGVVGFLLCVAGVALMGGSSWWLVRNGYYRRNARARVWGTASWARRRQLARQVRGTDARRDEDRPLLPVVARHLIDQPKFLPPLCGLALLEVGQAFLRWAPGFVLVAVFVVGLLAALAPLSFRSARQASAFLAEHADGYTFTEARAER
ncbi:hypothetical protein ACFY2Q_20245 [Micromonospora sp. NPDC000316]|uniref:hypothetical protein n=1 Tax=Micromonospora sp. NPDC000316 TaxID=3364216 RepID=UPI00369E93F3